MSITEGRRTDGMKTELRIQGLLLLNKYEFRYCKHLALVISRAKNALNLWLFFSLISSKHSIIN